MANPRLIRILSISDDFSVRSTRELVLRKDGYEIVSIGSNDLLSVPEIRAFDVAVLCHSVPDGRAMELLDRLRRYKPEIRVLRVNGSLPHVHPDYNVDSEVWAGPGTLLKAVRELLERSGGPSVIRETQSKGPDEHDSALAASPGNSGILRRM